VYENEILLYFFSVYSSIIGTLIVSDPYSPGSGANPEAGIIEYGTIFVKVKQNIIFSSNGYSMKHFQQKLFPFAFAMRNLGADGMEQT
jgi:hypothetical protein